MRPSEALAVHRDKIRSIAAARGACNVRVFGSVVHGTDRDGSDLDLLVDVAPGVSLYAYVGLQLDLEDALGVKVDVSTAEELHPEMKVRILSEARPV
jgi:predicted nucleotidyltransferase